MSRKLGALHASAVLLERKRAVAAKVGNSGYDRSIMTGWRMIAKGRLGSTPSVMLSAVVEAPRALRNKYFANVTAVYKPTLFTSIAVTFIAKKQL